MDDFCLVRFCCQLDDAVGLDVAFDLQLFKGLEEFFEVGFSEFFYVFTFGFRNVDCCVGPAVGKAWFAETTISSRCSPGDFFGFDESDLKFWVALFGAQRGP